MTNSPSASGTETSAEKPLPTDIGAAALEIIRQIDIDFETFDGRGKDIALFTDAMIDLAARIAAALSSERSSAAQRVREAERIIRAARAVANDLLTMQFPEECSDKTIARAKDNIAASGGTIAYVADLNEVVRDFLKDKAP